jgi:hypothetical protein
MAVRVAQLRRWVKCTWGGPDNLLSGRRSRKRRIGRGWGRPLVAPRPGQRVVRATQESLQNPNCVTRRPIADRSVRFARRASVTDRLLSINGGASYGPSRVLPLRSIVVRPRHDPATWTIDRDWLRSGNAAFPGRASVSEQRGSKRILASFGEIGSRRRWPLRLLDPKHPGRHWLRLGKDVFPGRASVSEQRGSKRIFGSFGETVSTGRQPLHPTQSAQGAIGFDWGRGSLARSGRVADTESPQMVAFVDRSPLPARTSDRTADPTSAGDPGDPV